MLVFTPLQFTRSCIASCPAWELQLRPQKFVEAARDLGLGLKLGKIVRNIAWRDQKRQKPSTYPLLLSNEPSHQACVRGWPWRR